MIDWKRKLTSRKFWVSVAAFVSELMYVFGCAQTVVERVVALIMAGATAIAYLIAEGLVDANNTGGGYVEEPDGTNLIGFVDTNEKIEEDEECP